MATNPSVDHEITQRLVTEIGYRFGVDVDLIDPTTITATRTMNEPCFLEFTCRSQISDHEFARLWAIGQGVKL